MALNEVTKLASTEGIIFGLKIALKTWGESMSPFNELMDTKRYYEEQLEKLKQ